MNLNIKEACRLCLGKSSKTCDEIFFPIDEDFERKFTEITDCILDVLNEAYPVNICNSCLTQFEEYYNYRKSLIEKQKRLNQLLNIRKDLKIVKKQKLEDLNENKFMS
ncbi:hypothetical protein PVAND_013549 [Polypedilum vanderplanki]|uniref:ZAD domain-containing protein n=1 Tax=Polypedilum vanderplanki TaxID=319348 RepID=A0A9J6CPR8_POLVA|nr:hypothetical protein PVAND_013549 [Polypedilum vanderplanki]